MTLYSYLWGLRVSALMMLAALAAVLFFIDPYALGAVAYALFYVTLFLAAASTSSLGLTSLWHKMAQQRISPAELHVTLRQGALIGVLVVMIVLLQQMRLLVWWDALLVMAAVLLIELFFLSRQA